MKHIKVMSVLIACALNFGSLLSNTEISDDSTALKVGLLKLDDDDVPYQPLVDLPVDLKSNRIINFQSTTVLPKGGFELSIQHRFGKIDGGIDQLWGVDNLNSMRLGFDYGLTKNLTVGLGRSSLKKTYNTYMKYRLIGKNSSKFHLTYLADLMVDGRATNDWGLSPFFFTHRMNYTHTLAASFNFNNSIFFGVSPSLVHFNLVENLNDANDYFTCAAYLRAKIIPKVFMTFEASQNFTTSSIVPQNQNPSVGFGIEYYTPKHVFQLSLSNTRGLNEPYVMVSDPAVSSFSQFCLGFNIVRRW